MTRAVEHVRRLGPDLEAAWPVRYAPDSALAGRALVPWRLNLAAAAGDSLFVATGSTLAVRPLAPFLYPCAIGASAHGASAPGEDLALAPSSDCEAHEYTANALAAGHVNGRPALAVACEGGHAIVLFADRPADRASWLRFRVSAPAWSVALGTTAAHEPVLAVGTNAHEAVVFALGTRGAASATVRAHTHNVPSVDVRRGLGVSASIDCTLALWRLDALSPCDVPADPGGTEDVAPAAEGLFASAAVTARFPLEGAWGWTARIIPLAELAVAPPASCVPLDDAPYSPGRGAPRVFRPTEGGEASVSDARLLVTDDAFSSMHDIVDALDMLDGDSDASSGTGSLADYADMSHAAVRDRLYVSIGRGERLSADVSLERGERFSADVSLQGRERDRPDVYLQGRERDPSDVSLQRDEGDRPDGYLQGRERDPSDVSLQRDEGDFPFLSEQPVGRSNDGASRESEEYTAAYDAYDPASRSATGDSGGEAPSPPWRVHYTHYADVGLSFGDASDPESLSGTSRDTGSVDEYSAHARPLIPSDNGPMIEFSAHTRPLSASGNGRRVHTPTACPHGGATGDEALVIAATTERRVLFLDARTGRRLCSIDYLEQRFLDAHGPPADIGLLAMSRLAMAHWLPALSVLAVGSQLGFVALVHVARVPSCDDAPGSAPTDAVGEDVVIVPPPWALRAEDEIRGASAVVASTWLHGLAVVPDPCGEPRALLLAVDGLGRVHVIRVSRSDSRVAFERL